MSLPALGSPQEPCSDGAFYRTTDGMRGRGIDPVIAVEDVCASASAAMEAVHNATTERGISPGLS